MCRNDAGFVDIESTDLRIGTSMMGPLPLTTSNSMPSAGRGVKMSLNIMTPSGWKASQGCKESVRAMSVVSERSLKLYLSEYLQNAWLLIGADRARHKLCIGLCEAIAAFECWQALRLTP